MKKKLTSNSYVWNTFAFGNTNSKKLKIQNPELKQFIESLDLIDRLDPRESFFGGRTIASQLYYKTEEQDKIK
jgi:hypothetical protein